VFSAVDEESAFDSESELNDFESELDDSESEVDDSESEVDDSESEVDDIFFGTGVLFCAAHLDLRLVSRLGS